MKGYQFEDTQGTFHLKKAENISYLYFPIAGEAGLKSSFTPNLGGDAKIDQNTFLLEPVSAENLVNNRNSRNFWCNVKGIGSWSLTGNAAEALSKKFTEMQDDSEQISTYDMSYECQDLQSVANDESFPLEERDKAAEQLEQLAKDGDAYAQYIIGTAYRDGGLLIPDTAKAQKLLERAAEQDLDVAQYALGKLYLSDDADVHDSAKGIYWLKRSADNGNDFAAYRLGKEYLSGKNTIKDAETAVSYLRQAADNGSAYAQYLLGKLTLMGEGVPKDPDTAYEWFAAARDNGHAYAEFFMKRMERGEQEPPSVLLSATRLLYHMGNIFRDNAPAPAANGVQIDRKRLAQLRQKRVALGHKLDDHELEQQQGFSMKFHM